MFLVQLEKKEEPVIRGQQALLALKARKDTRDPLDRMVKRDPKARQVWTAFLELAASPGPMEHLGSQGPTAPMASQAGTGNPDETASTDPTERMGKTADRVNQDRRDKLAIRATKAPKDRKAIRERMVIPDQLETMALKDLEDLLAVKAAKGHSETSGQRGTKADPVVQARRDRLDRQDKPDSMEPSDTRDLQANPDPRVIPVLTVMMVITVSLASTDSQATKDPWEILATKDLTGHQDLKATLETLGRPDEPAQLASTAIQETMVKRLTTTRSRTDFSSS